MLDNNINELHEKFKKELNQTKSIVELEKVKSNYLGKKSFLISTFKSLKSIKNIDERKYIAQKANKLRKIFDDSIIKKREEIYRSDIEQKLASEKIDISLPGIPVTLGSYHPLTLIQQRIINILHDLGFQYIVKNEVTTESYAFDKLNIDVDHPSRSIAENFNILNSNKLLRPHATSVTSEMLELIAKNNISTAKVFTTGNAYRRDTDDATHSHQFMQVDIFSIGNNVNFETLVQTINKFCQLFFSNPNISTRIRPSFFPFTYCSLEMDINCIYCNGSGCSICKNSGWIEVLGAGLIHPNVYKSCGLGGDMNGFAIGIGIDRLAMLFYNVKDLRLFYTNDIKFLSQFSNLSNTILY